jgi:transposase
MFIREKKGEYKGKTYVNYQLVESFRTPKGPRQRVVCSLGDLGPRPFADWLKLVYKIESVLVGQADLFGEADEETQGIVDKIKLRQAQEESNEPPTRAKGEPDEVVGVLTSKVTTESDLEAGPAHVAYQYWKKLGMNQMLSDVGLNQRERKLTCLMTMNRVLAPCSEHAMPDWIRTTALGDILEDDLDTLSEDPLYRNLDALYPKRAVIEARLADKERDLFNLDQTIFLYDLTSTYFEGQSQKNWKAKKGWSRDKRPDCDQVVVGLVVNRDGFPVAHEVFEGNTQDNSTVEKMLDLLDERVGLTPGRTVVVDRGMACDKNIAHITSRGLHYLVASRQSQRDQWLEEFEDAEGFEEIELGSSPTNPYQRKTPVRVRMKQTPEQTHVLCVSAGRTQKDRAIRLKQEKRLLADLAKLGKRVADGRLVKPEKIWEVIGRLKERYPRVARYHHIEYDAENRKFSAHLLADKSAVAESLDGSYLLKTDRKDLTAEEAWRIYNMLTKAEAAFRAMKSPLSERPIFHQLQKRVDTHIFLCVLAYHILVAIEKTLRDKGVHTSLATVRQQLKTHRISTIVLPTTSRWTLKIRKCSNPEPQHREIYQLLEVPEQIVPAKKMWVEDNDNV